MRRYPRLTSQGFFTLSLTPSLSLSLSVILSLSRSFSLSLCHCGLCFLPPSKQTGNCTTPSIRCHFSLLSSLLLLSFSSFLSFSFLPHNFSMSSHTLLV